MVSGRLCSVCSSTNTTIIKSGVYRVTTDEVSGRERARQKEIVTSIHCNRCGYVGFLSKKRPKTKNKNNDVVLGERVRDHRVNSEKWKVGKVNGKRLVE